MPEGGHREGGMVFVDASYGKVPVPDLNVFVSADVTDDDILIMLGLKQPPEQPRMEID